MTYGFQDAEAQGSEKQVTCMEPGFCMGFTQSYLISSEVGAVQEKERHQALESDHIPLQAFVLKVFLLASW